MNESARLSDVKVGAFVLVALLILVIGSLWIAGSALFGSRRVAYVVLLEGCAGLQPGDRVRVVGVSVGRIKGVRLLPEEPWPVALQIAVKASVPVREDSTAKIASSGLLGASYLQLEPGSPGAPLLRPGGEIHGRPSFSLESSMARVDVMADKVSTLLDQTSGVLEQVSSEIQPIMDKLNRVLDEENAENIRQILASLRQTTNDAAPRLSTLLARLESVSVELEGGLEGLPDLTEKVSGLVDDVQLAFGPDGVRLTAVLDAAERSLTSADATLSTFAGNREEIEATVRDLRDTVANLKAFSQAAKERPFSLVRIKPEPDRRPGQGVARR